MKRIQNISLSAAILTICAVLALSSCRKRPQPSTPEDQKTLIGFSAVSQSSAVKAVADNSLANYHEDFGVWGIARHTNNAIAPYILWSEDALTQVVKSTEDGSHSFIPTEAAFWIVGYTYNFIALAPYDSGASDIYFTRRSASTPGSKDAISFTYDMAPKYDTGQASDYVFDLMGAAAETPVSASRTDAQDLTFWHLFAQINIKVEFVGATGTVNEMRLYNVDSKADYTISLDSSNELKVSPEVSSDASQEIVIFNGMNQDGNILNIVPQDISDFKLFLDFTITKNDQAQPQTSSFEVDLSKAYEYPNYGNNQKYNWTIKISPKEISFDVILSPWVPGTDQDFEFELEYPNE